MVDIKNYEYNGFKLYHREEIIESSKTVIKNEYDIVVQYKNGLPFKIWSQEILTKDGETWDRWVPESLHFLDKSDIFVKNLEEEDIFTIFL